MEPLEIFNDKIMLDKTVLVTGGGRGIGGSIAIAFAKLGANVVIASRNEAHRKPTEDAIRALGRKCLSITMSIRVPEEVDALVDATLKEMGGIDVLVNNAGGQFPARPSEISDGGWRSVVDLNLNGTWNMCNRVSKVMVQQKSGSIINMVHVYSMGRGAPPFVHSGAARAGVISMTKSLAYYLARHGVTINAIAPGTIDTTGVREEEFSAAETENYEAAAVANIPAQRLGSVDEVAALVVFLSSPAARYINGSTIVADGAQYMGNWTPMFDPEIF